MAILVAGLMNCVGTTGSFQCILPASIIHQSSVRNDYEIIVSERYVGKTFGTSFFQYIFAAGTMVGHIS